MSKLGATPWWKDPKGDGPHPHARLIPLVHSMQRSQSSRYQNMRRMQAVYEYGYTATTEAGGNGPIEDRLLQFNIAKGAIDTMLAGLLASRITCMVLTEGGTWSQRQRAKLATKAVDGVCDDNDVEELTEDVARDAHTSYCGFFKVRSDVHAEDEDGDNDDADGPKVAEIRVERAIPDDIYVDEAEGRHRKPRCIYHRYFVDRYVALALWGGTDPDLYGAAGDRKAAIRKAPVGGSGEVPELRPENMASGEMIEVWESWHLPSGPVRFDKNGKATHDGRHCIAVDGATIVFEPWNRERFPFAVYRPEKAHKGFWGLAAMRQAMAAQREHAVLDHKIQQQNKRMGVTAFVAQQDSMDLREIADGQGMIWVASNPEAVKPLVVDAVAQQTYQYRGTIAQDLLRYFGVSQFSAQNEVPAGLSQASGKALQKFADEGDKRQILRHRALERAKVDLFDLIIDEARACIKAGFAVRTRYHDKHGFEPIDWSEIVKVVEDRKAYVVKSFPVGMLAQTPSAKFAQLDVLLERQIITTEQFKRLFGMPDLEAEADVDCADYEMVDRVIDKMVTTGRYMGPLEPWDDPELVLARGRKILQAYRIAEVPDGRLALVRRYLADAEAEKTKRAQQAAAAEAEERAAMQPTAPAEDMGVMPDPMAGAPPVDPAALAALPPAA